VIMSPVSTTESNNIPTTVPSAQVPGSRRILRLIPVRPSLTDGSDTTSDSESNNRPQNGAQSVRSPMYTPLYTPRSPSFDARSSPYDRNPVSTPSRRGPRTLVHEDGRVYGYLGPRSIQRSIPTPPPPPVNGRLTTVFETGPPSPPRPAMPIPLPNDTNSNRPFDRHFRTAAGTIPVSHLEITSVTNPNPLTCSVGHAPSAAGNVIKFLYSVERMFGYLNIPRRFWGGHIPQYLRNALSWHNSNCTRATSWPMFTG